MIELRDLANQVNMHGKIEVWSVNDCDDDVRLEVTLSDVDDFGLCAMPDGFDWHVPVTGMYAEDGVLVVDVMKYPYTE